MATMLEKQFLLLSLSSGMARRVFDGITESVMSNEEFDIVPPVLMSFRETASMTAAAFAEEHDCSVSAASGFLDELCSEGLLLKNNKVYSASPKLQAHFDRFDAVLDASLKVIFNGLSEEEHRMLENLLGRIGKSCDDYIEKHPELFADTDDDDDEDDDDEECDDDCDCCK